MIERLHLLVEGQTEETFAEEVLGGYLLGKAHPAYTKITARTLIKEAGQDGGGIVKWERARRLICKRLTRDPKCIVTTMVDYYALPKSWIDRARYKDQPTAAKAVAVRCKLAKDIQSDLRTRGSTVALFPMSRCTNLRVYCLVTATCWRKGLSTPSWRATSTPSATVIVTAPPRT